ncbi:hypothetical protein HRG_008190 [Hirsutella rhossiliensis]|uniref:Uncharacterized protein n=1 Tax=Hirsutella rhossiliensis TaxID=111463 RepID=A0A9P8MTB0_9HYPO|nr:uncharacterized protein HRG_08190 [Hirsutella rhossiliensis]KAH0961037.1 hypothetical protein HRG_08190 [Hirsutella rhossiliensis]
MIPERALAALFFTLGAHGAATGDFGVLDLGDLARRTQKAQRTIRRLKGDILAKGPPHVAYDLKGEGYACYHMHRPLLATPEGLDIEIVANIDKEFSTGSSAASIDISTSTARVDTSSSGLRIEDSTTIGAEASVTVGFAGSGATVSISGSQTGSNEQNSETGQQNELREDVSMTFECPAQTTCSIQTWTYVAKLTGTCPQVPTVDPVCFDRLVQGVGSSDEFPAHEALKNFMQANLTLPSVNEQVPAWAKIGAEYYNMTKKNNSPAGKVLPSKLIGNNWWASEKEYTITWTENKPCDLATPLYQDNKTPKRSQVIVEYPDKLFDKRMVKRDEEQTPEELGLKVIILREFLD